MTTRHTITHADEIYVGAAFQDSYSPDGRRGIKMTHLYAHEFLSTAGVPAVAGDSDGFLPCMVVSDITGWSASGGNLISVMSGPLMPGPATAATYINLDVPRNVVITVCQGTPSTKYFKFHGVDCYGEAMAETVKCHAAGVEASGVRAFKEIHKIYTTAAIVSTVAIGTGNRLGLPFNLADKGKLISVSIGGKQVTSGGTGVYIVYIGASAATTIDTTNGNADARGTIRMVNPVPDGSTRFTALMVVDHTTRRKAFGPPQVSSCSNGVG